MISVDIPINGPTSVTLPDSDRVLFESDIDSKIKKTKRHIDHLSNAQSHRKTHGGKRFRAKQLSLRTQLDSTAQRLIWLESVKKVFIAVNKIKSSYPDWKHSD